MEFNAAPESAELSEDFTGLRHRRIDALSTEISCGAIIRSLNDLIVPFLSFFSPKVPTSPLPDNGLFLLASLPVGQETLRLDLLPHA